MKLKKLRNNRGVSLLEVLVAMMITSLSLLMLLNMAMIALDGNDWANKTTLATQLLQEKLEELRGGGPSVLSSGSDTAQGLTRTWRVSTVSSHLSKVDVNIAWDDIKATQHTSSLTAYIRTD
jgi:type II secretion system protein I